MSSRLHGVFDSRLILTNIYHICTVLVLRFFFFFCSFFFFFKAEDGIRDLVRSRGLGDVYKRQVHKLMRCVDLNIMLGQLDPADSASANEHWVSRESVSYTHLTLPTSDLV